MLKSGLIWKIAGPMIGLGAVLLGLGGFAAWNVHRQHRITSEAIVQEVHSLFTVSELYAAMREIRYQINMYLRTKSVEHLDQVVSLHLKTDELLHQAKDLAGNEQERVLIHQAEEGYDEFFERFSKCREQLVPSTASAAVKEDRDSSTMEELAFLVDTLMTDRVLQPLHLNMQENEEVVDRTNMLGRSSSKQLAGGLLFLGLCGGAAGVLMGIAVARTVGRSIVQMNVSVQSVASRLSNVSDHVSFTHYTDIAGIESNLRSLESDIENIVETLQQRESELIRSEQLAKVGQMAAGLAHELRNPLMPMKMLVQAALRSEGKGKLTQESLSILNEEIIRLEDTITSFLEFARPSLPHLEVMDICEMIRQFGRFVEGRLAQSNVVLNLRLPETPVYAKVDRNQCKQLFLNLLNNAIDAMPDGGEYRIEVGRVSSLTALGGEFNTEERSQIESSRFRVAEWLSVVFSDSGTGIDPTFLSNIFEPFVTSKETGTGLGLSVCRQIAIAHRGILTASNCDGGRGAKFTLLIPLSDGV